MLRKAFVMFLHPGCEDEYARRHRPIWPDLERELKAHGASNYSIFLEPASRRLFAYVEIESEERWSQVANTAACRRWWAHMQDLMDSNADGSPRAETLTEVFHLA
ncbi:MAG: L-rhamnose mutarotase [Verrucomicrobia bacterium]|nr:L-rhamnose mutarotase [Verrucomicrobiota bacterium]